MTDHYPFENTPLPYSYDSLEPNIDTKTMKLHHDKHLQTYVDHLNSSLKDYPELHTLTLEQLIYYGDRLPKAIQIPVEHNAGGVYNHRFYFYGLKHSDMKMPVGMLAEAIFKTFGSFSGFKKEFTTAALSVFGSGYAWLACGNNGKLKIITTANQETPLTQNLCPVITIDVWEHAYYLKHYNMRSVYIDDWFNVIYWEKANENYMMCKSFYA